ncbi:MAG: STAS domain-containing protein [Chitinophagales bacterium]|nr:STAS domain-containing protein [Chitinophagales bacterium]
MELIQEVQNNITVIQLEGNVLSDADSKVILSKVQESIDDGKNDVIFDLSKTRFVNSSGIGALITSMTKARKAGGNMVLACVPDSVSKLLEITKLDGIVTQVDTVSDAKALITE